MKHRLFLEKIFIRNVSYWRLVEIFLVTAVSTLVLVRFFLELTDYPRLGGERFHIAHMLWGGLLLGTALMMSIIFISRRINYVSAAAGGIGFGLFIDELGKFITTDNNYLYQPTLAIIYVLFIIFFFTLRQIGSGIFTEEEYAVNSLELIKDGAIDDMTKEEKERGLYYLSFVRKHTAGIDLLRRMYEEIPAVTPGRIDLVALHLHRAKMFYKSFSEKEWFAKLVIGFFIVSAIGTIAGVLGLVGMYVVRQDLLVVADISTPSLLQAVASLAGACFVILGSFKLRRSRLAAYMYFKRYILIDILVATVFEFYTDQLWAVLGLLFDLFLLVSLNFMIDSEKE